MGRPQIRRKSWGELPASESRWQVAKKAMKRGLISGADFDGIGSNVDFFFRIPMQGSFKLYTRFWGINTMDMSVEYEGFPVESVLTVWVGNIMTQLQAHCPLKTNISP